MTLVAGSARADTPIIPFSGTVETFTIDPGVQWTDEDGVTHIRGMVQTGALVGEDENGLPLVASTVYVTNINIDADGNGDCSSKQFWDGTYDDLTGTFRGNAVATITDFFFEGTWNYPRGTGDFARWHSRGTWSTIFNSGVIVYDGYFQIPGDKSGATEARTWSAVKALYD
jgi:hypothetical protein